MSRCNTAKHPEGQLLPLALWRNIEAAGTVDVVFCVGPMTEKCPITVNRSVS